MLTPGLRTEEAIVSVMATFDTDHLDCTWPILCSDCNKNCILCRRGEVTESLEAEDAEKKLLDEIRLTCVSHRA
jgi:hypothetical protein